MPVASAALLARANHDRSDLTLLETVLANPATCIVTRASVAGPEQQPLTHSNPKPVTFYLIQDVASMWEQSQSEHFTGKLDDDESWRADCGTELTATLQLADRKLEADLHFKWTPDPVRRPYTSYPVKVPGAAAVAFFQPWEFAIKTKLTHGISLLAASPESTGPDSQELHSGSMLMAFGRAGTAGDPLRPPDSASSGTPLQSWTFDVPLPAGNALLRERRSDADDVFLLQRLSTDKAATLVSCAAIASPAEESSVSSLLTGHTARGFVPSGCREFRAIACESMAAEIEHRMEVTDADLIENLLVVRLKTNHPAAPMRWEKWHGSTIGARDEPAGVETALCGEDVWEGNLHLRPNQALLGSARTIGDRVRFTFFCWVRDAPPGPPHTSLPPQPPFYVRILETPVHPWLELSGQPRRAELYARLEKALDTGEAKLLNLTLHQAQDNAYRSQSASGMSFLLHDCYMNTSIRGDHWFYNPRFAISRSLGMRAEFQPTKGPATTEFIDMAGRQRYALWLPHSPLHTRENSGIERPILFQTTCNYLGTTHPQESAFAVVLAPASTLRKEPALRWILRSSSASTALPPSAVILEEIEYTLIQSNEPCPTHPEPLRANPAGKVLAFQRAGTATYVSCFLKWDGPDNQCSPDSAAKGTPPGTTFQDQADFLDTRCGLQVTCAGNQWTATYRPPPKIITTELLGMDETPPVEGIPWTARQIRVSCESPHYEAEAKAAGPLPPTGSQACQTLGNGRILIVRRHAASLPGK